MYWCSTILFAIVLEISRQVRGIQVPFDVNYQVTWGMDHVTYINQGLEVLLSMDKSSGAGFASKSTYGSGFFSMKIKLHDKDSAGVVSGFYLTSNSPHHQDELDVEFLGNTEGKPYTLQTNIYVNGIGGREQRFFLWFNPAADFHTYKILWNEHQVVFYVEDVPIRVLKNRSEEGISYPSQPMHVDGTIWDGDSWATDGGRTKTNWSHAPFNIHFQGFSIDGCPTPPDSNTPHCFSSNYWWNAQKFWDLDSGERKLYEYVRKTYLNYDYCTDRDRYPVAPPDCL